MSKKSADECKICLESLIKKLLKFDDRYACWITNNLHNLNSGSLTILQDLNPKKFKLVLYSTVVGVNTPVSGSS